MKHEMRYPKHEGDKGTKFDGVCNRTACDHLHATFFNVMTKGYYCSFCAEGSNSINYWSTRDTGKSICIRVDRDLTVEEMDSIEHKGLVAA